MRKNKPESNEETADNGLGPVVMLNVNGYKLLNLQNGLWENFSWGISMAPRDFGTFSYRLLIGNLGDGIIDFFNAVFDHFEDPLLDATNKPNPVVIHGLWALSIGVGNPNSSASIELYFSTGPNDVPNGLFGKLTAYASVQKGNSE